MGNNNAERKPIKEPGERTLPRGLYITIKTGEEFEAKQKIAKHIVKKYIKDFDAVLLDAGSTCELIAEEMFEKRKFLSVLTNNMGAYAAYTRAGKTVSRAQESEPSNQGNELRITSGRYVDVYEALMGEGAIASIAEFTPNVIILGTSGLRCDEGIFCHGTEDAAVKKLLWDKHVDTRLIAADWTKIGRRDANAFGILSRFNLHAGRAVIITNNPPSELFDSDPHVREFYQELEKLKSMGIEVESVDDAK